RRDEDAVALAPVDLQPRMSEHEVLSERRRRLGLAEHEEAAVAQGEGEQLEGALLEVGREVDQDVATEREIDARERRALAPIVLTEDGDRTDLLADLESVGDLREVALEDVRRHLGERGFRVDAATSEGDGVAVDVGREDPNVEAVELVAERLGDQDRETVGLLA